MIVHLWGQAWVINSLKGYSKVHVHIYVKLEMYYKTANNNDILKSRMGMNDMEILLFLLITQTFFFFFLPNLK